jgi:hypothetical protein
LQVVKLSNVAILPGHRGLSASIKQNTGVDGAEKITNLRMKSRAEMAFVLVVDANRLIIERFINGRTGPALRL